MEEGLDVFNEEFKMNIDPMELLFPPLSVDASTQIRQFGNPGQFCSEEAILDPTVFGVALLREVLAQLPVSSAGGAVAHELDEKQWFSMDFSELVTVTGAAGRTFSADTQPPQRRTQSFAASAL